MIHVATIALYGPAALIVLALAWGVFRIAYLAKEQNVSVLSLMSRQKTLAEWWLMAIAVVLNAYLLARPIFQPELDLQLLSMNHPYGHYGIPFMVAGIAIAVLSQFQMGVSWRIGIPALKEDSQKLVTDGLYRLSRNPIYLGVMLFLIGAVIVIPGPLTILSLIMAWGLTNHIIDQEEAFLEKSFGEVFLTYKGKVGRWV